MSGTTALWAAEHSVEKVAEHADKHQGATHHTPEVLGMLTNPLAITCIVVFCIAYIFVILEEKIHMRKSKPVVFAAGVIWVIVAYLAQQKGVDKHTFKAVLSHNLIEFSELLLFLLVAMTYINAMTERRIFRTLRYWLVMKGFTFRQLFWITGILAFVLSPIADNLTTALLLGAVVLAVGGKELKFVQMACINIVVAANAGGAFSPFGDITTLMVWQADKVEFFGFFKLFLPALTNFLVPSLIMSCFIPKGKPEAGEEIFAMRKGAKRIVFLFFITIALAVGMKQAFNLPPYMGMMFGMSLLLFFGYYLKLKTHDEKMGVTFNVFNKVEKAEWDTLFFFFGVIYCVGGLSYIGYLGSVSDMLYHPTTGIGTNAANIAAGGLSALIDNIPVMFAILTMSPEMSQYEWLQVTLTAGVGGSLLSVGSAAGVALMGQAKGKYSFMGHLKWSWVIALGYIASLYVHYLVNAPAKVAHVPKDKTAITAPADLKK